MNVFKTKYKLINNNVDSLLYIQHSNDAVSIDMNLKMKEANYNINNIKAVSSSKYINLSLDRLTGKGVIHSTAIVGVDLNQKGMATPQQFGSASSYAKKYALGNLLLIDDTADADATNNHGRDIKPKINSNNIEKAKKFLSNGGLLKTLQDKYDITPDALKELQNG
jgi:hypothetical protein